MESKSLKEVIKRYKRKYSDEPPTKRTIYQVYLKFKNTGTTHNQNAASGQPKMARSEAHITSVREAISDDPKTSIRMLSAQLNVPKSTIHRIVKLDLGLYPYKLQIKQSLIDYDCARRLEFAHWMLGWLERTPSLLDLIWFSDESHFHLDGHVNSQNCRYWGTDKPTDVLERPLHSAKVTVWCALSSQGIIGPFFFEEDDKLTA